MVRGMQAQACMGAAAGGGQRAEERQQQAVTVAWPGRRAAGALPARWTPAGCGGSQRPPPLVPPHAAPTRAWATRKKGLRPCRSLQWPSSGVCGAVRGSSTTGVTLRARALRCRPTRLSAPTSRRLPARTAQPASPKAPGPAHQPTSTTEARELEEGAQTPASQQPPPPAPTSTHQHDGDEGVGEEGGPGGPQHHVGVRVLLAGGRRVSARAGGRRLQGGGRAWGAARPGGKARLRLLHAVPPRPRSHTAGPPTAGPPSQPAGGSAARAASRPAHPAGQGVGVVPGQALAVHAVPRAPPRKVVGHDARDVRDQHRHAWRRGGGGGGPRRDEGGAGAPRAAAHAAARTSSGTVPQQRVPPHPRAAAPDM